MAVDEEASITEHAFAEDLSRIAAARWGRHGEERPVRVAKQEWSLGYDSLAVSLNDVVPRDLVARFVSQGWYRGCLTPAHDLR